jgi:tetratricopeptide (TPR) repeat protein
MERFSANKIGAIAKIAIAICVTATFVLGANGAKDAYERGLAAHEQGVFQGAIMHYTQALEIDPNFADAYIKRADAYNDLSYFEKAIKGYDKAIAIECNKHTNAYSAVCKLDVKYASVFAKRGEAYNNLGDHKKAIEDFTQAINTNPNDATYYLLRGVAYADICRTYKSIHGYREVMKKAIADFDRALKIDPAFWNAYAQRGFAYEKLGDYKSATKDARKACELGFCGALEYLEQEKLLSY